MNNPLQSCNFPVLVETIEWRSADPSRQDLPTADETTALLVNAPGDEDPVWIGYYDGESWFNNLGIKYDAPDGIPRKVAFWAEMPKGVRK